MNYKPLRMFKGKLKWIQLLLFVFCFTLVGIRVFKAPIYNSGDKRDFIRGDAYSDKNVHSAVQYFYHNGFDTTVYLPVYGYDSVGDKDYTVYTHYPALPDLLAGGYALLLDTTNIKSLRIFPVLLSVGWFFLIFHFLSQALPHRQKAFLSACVIVLSTYFLGWADTLHKHTYEEAFKWAFVYLLFLYYEHFFRNKFFLTALGGFFVIIANISYEPIAYLAVVVVGFSLIYRQRIFTVETITLGFSAILGFGIHFLQVVEHFGSFQAAKDDLLSAAVVRTTGEATGKMASERNIAWGITF